MVESQAAERADAKSTSGFLKYTFFKLAREWRSLPQPQKESAGAEFVALLDQASAKLSIQTFSLVGIRGDADFMLLVEAEALETFQDVIASILSSGLGRYLDIPYSYLALTRQSHYTRPSENASVDPPVKSKYLFVYPFVKMRSWYGLPFDERQRIMGEHFRVGRKYPKIKINTGYSFGLDDQEFVLAFEGDDPAQFLGLVEELRSTEASKYTELETPIFTCLRTEPAKLLRLIG